MPEPVAAFLEVRKRYTRRGPWVLRGIDLELGAGTAIAVFGGNGSGKSTMLRIAAGLCAPTTGSVSRASQVGYVPERQPARISMSGSEYLAHMGRIRGLGRSTINSRSAELFERLNLTPGPDAEFRSLSKGNRQKLLLSQAFLVDVPLLVLDEPFNGLDADGFRTLSELLTEARSAGTSVLMSAHEAENVPAFFETCRLTEGGLVDARPSGVISDQNASDVVRVVLQVGVAACDPNSIAALQGTRAASAGPEGMLTLMIDREHREQILSTAIASGWRVLSVGPATGSPRESEDR